MVEDAAQAYNPIIQAMIATANLQKQGQQQEIEKERNKQEAAAKQEGLKQAQKALDYQHEHNLAQIKIQGMQAEAQAEAQRAETLLRHQAFVQAGGDYKSLPGYNGGNAPLHQPTPDQLGFSPVAGSTPVQQPQAAAPANPFGSADEAAAIQARAAGAKAGAIAQAQVGPEKEIAAQKFGYESNLQQAARDSQEKIAALGRASQEKIAGLSRSTEMAIANMHNRTQLQVAGMGGDEQSQNLVKSLMMGGATGEIKLNPANPLERLAYSNLQQSGFQEVDPKQAQAAKEAQKLLPLFDRLEKFADQLPDTAGGAMLQGAKTHVANAIGMPTKFQNDISMINSQAMNVGKSMEGLSGRPLRAQLELDLNTLASSTTKSMMKERIDNLRQNYYNNMQNVIFSGMPQAQQEIVAKKWGLQTPSAGKPDWLRLAPQKSKIGGTLDEDASLKIGKPVYR